MGGLGLCNPSGNTNFEFDSSLQVTALVQEITEQQTHFRVTVVCAQSQAKANVMSLRCQQLVSKQSELTPLLPADLHRIVSFQGASSWLSVLPIEEHVYGFALHIKVLLGMHCVCIMDGFSVASLPSVCVVMASLLIIQ